MPRLLLAPLLRSAALVAMAACLVAPAASAQDVVFDTFDDGDLTNVGTFAGGDVGIGFGPTDGADGTADTALSVGINPGSGGSFAGFFVTAATAIDVTGTNYLTFSFRPTTVQAANLPITLEINLQEDANGDGAYDPATEDEYQAVFDVPLGSDYTRVEIPLYAFADDNSVNGGSNDGFDFTRVIQIVGAIGGLQGPEFAFAIDDIVFTESSEVVVGDISAFDNFDDGDLSNVGTFAGGDVGIGVGTTTGITGADATALSVGINPGSGGSFAGFFIPVSTAIDASDADYLSFFFRPTTVQAGNQPLRLEINLQEDSNGNGTYDPATEDEYQAVYDVPLGTDYTRVDIPLYAFADDNSVNGGSNDGFDFTRVIQIVGAIGGLQGPEFAFAIDELGFASSTPVGGTASEALPSTFAAAPVAFPNPTAGFATVAFELASASDVSVEVYDLLGRRVATIADGPQAAGAVRLSVPTNALTPGVYVVRVQTSAGVASTQLSVVR